MVETAESVVDALAERVTWVASVNAAIVVTSVAPAAPAPGTPISLPTSADVKLAPVAVSAAVPEVIDAVTATRTASLTRP